MKKISWTRLWGRKFAPLISSMFVYSYEKDRQFGRVSKKMFIPEGSLMAMYFDKPDLEKVVKNYGNFLKKQDITQYAKEYEQEFRDFLTYARKISKAEPSKLGSKDLNVLMQELNHKLIYFVNIQFHTFLVLLGLATELENKLLKQKDGSEALQAIISPYKLTKITKIRLGLLRLAKLKSKSGLNSYAKKYGWLPVYDPLDNPWDIEEFKSQIKETANPDQEIKTTLEHSKNNLKAYKKFLSSVTNPKLKKEIEIVHYFSYLKEMRDDYRREAYFLLGIFLGKLANHLKFSFIDIIHLTMDELRESVKQGHVVVANKEIKERQKAFAFVVTDGKLKTLSGQLAINLGKKMLPKITSKVQGSPANMGKVRGKVSVVYHQGEFKKFKTGQILITTMTHPEFLPIMKRAKAIVTDEGGIPCIIGTKNATQAFKDGDMVVVDANKGIVRKI